MDPDHPFDTLLGGVVECGDQLVDTIDKVGDILRHFRLIDRALHAGASASCQYCCRALSWISWPSRRAEFCSSGLKTVAVMSATSF